jgi:phage/plasmid-like protein (TIGR03299 family)
MFERTTSLAPAPRETRPETAAQAVQAYGLDWQVDLAPVHVLVDPGGQVPPRPMKTARAVVRLDTNDPLSIVGRRYRPIQNAEAFQIFDPVIAKFGASYEGAGSCDGGRRVWIQAKLPGGLWVTKEDEVEKFLLLHMRHGGGSLQVLDTPIRVWCKNTLKRALEEGKHRTLRIRHLGDTQGRIQEAEQLLMTSLSGFEKFEEEARAFAGRQLRKEALDAYFITLVPDPNEGDPSRARAVRGDLVRLFEMGKGNTLPSVRGTLWSAVNAAVEYVDHERTTKGSDKAASRWKSAQFGTGAAVKARAWREALGLLSKG